MTYGTSHFVSLSAAVRYYKPYGYDAADVRRKLKEGEIHVGKPSLKPGEKLSVIDGGKRYAITTGGKENPATASLPRNKWINGSIRVTPSGKIQVKVSRGSALKRKKTATRRKR